MNILKKNFGKNYYHSFLYKEKNDSQRNKNRFKEIIGHKKTGKLLEIGCGEGKLLKELARSFNVEGIDISQYAAQQAENLIGKKIFQKDIEKYSFPEKYYDVIVAFNLLEHTKNPYSVINKIHSSLKKEGVLFGSVPNNSGIVGKFFTYVSNIVDRTHRSTYHPLIWKKNLKTAGFEDILFFGELPIGRNINLYIKNKFWKYLSPNLMFICKK
jgi:2-polyprenyl-3-methyl-5-hydroxy-6-metoxy-1,4-benzoquinol methylase